jgi:DNA-binding transcriptional LysR family regulator
MILDWDDIRYFVAAAKGGSTLAASRVLGVSQTTVARRIDQLEQRIALRLFERHSGGYRLTTAGLKVLDDAEAVAWDVTGFLSLFPAGQAPIRGVFRVVVEEPLARPLLLPAVDAIRLKLPLVQWELVAKGVSADVATSDADIGIHLVAPSPRSGLTYRVLDAAVAWAAFSRDGAGSERLELRHSTGLAALVAAAKRGDGVAVLPACLAQTEPELTPWSGRSPRRTHLWISYPERRVPGAVIDLLADALTARLAPRPGLVKAAPAPRSFEAAAIASAA